MPRKPRLFVPGILYHLLSRGNAKQNIFLSKKDYREFLERLRQIKKKKPFSLYAYCLMPNHFHLLLEAQQWSPSIIMQRLLTSYTLYFNTIHQRCGHLFQGRYKSILCEKDSYLLELIRYIHLNPVRAGLVKFPEDWEWSGHRENLGTSQDLTIDQGKVLSYFGDTINKARGRYADFLKDGLSIGHQGEFYPEEKSSFLGGEKFVDDLKIRHLEVLDNLTPERKKRETSSLSEILAEIAVSTGSSSALIKGSSRVRQVSRARKEFIQEAMKSGHKGSDISRFLNRSPEYITKVADQQIIS